MIDRGRGGGTRSNGVLVGASGTRGAAYLAASPASVLRRLGRFLRKQQVEALVETRENVAKRFPLLISGAALSILHRGGSAGTRGNLLSLTEPTGPSIVVLLPP